MKKGLIMTIDGGDRAGKHTQANLLYHLIDTYGYKTALLDFPQYNSVTGQLVKEYLAGDFGSKEQLGAKLPSTLYSFDRVAKKDMLYNWLDEGRIIVLDRYTESNMGFMGAKLSPPERKEYLEWLEDLEYNKLKLPRSDIVLYLHVPYSFSEQLALKEELEEGKKRDIHEADKEFQIKVIDNYLQLAKEKNWYVIECIEDGKLLPPQDISNKIWTVVEPKLPKQ